MIYVQKLAMVEAVQVTAELLEDHKGDPGYKQAVVGDYFVSHGGGTPVLTGKAYFEANFEPCSDDYAGNDPVPVLIEGLAAANARIVALEKKLAPTPLPNVLAKPEAPSEKAQRA